MIALAIAWPTAIAGFVWYAHGFITSLHAREASWRVSTGSGSLRDVLAAGEPLCPHDEAGAA